MGFSFSAEFSPRGAKVVRIYICSQNLVRVPMAEYNSSMEIDTNKIDDAVLALLHLTRCDPRFGAAAWKTHDWDALNRLHEKGYIENPVSQNKSVGLTEEGQAKAEEVFWKLFGKVT